jgi:hypothetical protein
VAVCLIPLSHIWGSRPVKVLEEDGENVGVTEELLEDDRIADGCEGHGNILPAFVMMAKNTQMIALL